MFLQIQIIQHDGTPIFVKENKITIMYGCNCYDDERLAKLDYNLDADGKVLLTFNVPYNNINIKVY